MIRYFVRVMPIGADRRRSPLRVLLWVALLQGISACAPLARFAADGQLAGNPVMTRVDSREAAYYLGSYLPGQRTDPKLTARIESGLAEYGGAPRDRIQLQSLARALSPDLATMHFIAQLYDQPDNRRMQDEYHRFLTALTTLPRDQIVTALAPFTDYQIVFIPGYAYRSNPANGADFSRQRALLTELGFAPVLIETEELGLVERNTAIVTAALRELAAEHDKLVLVSASKGGAELAAALEMLSAEPAIDSVKAWISVGGLLRGSPYADRYLHGVRRWAARYMLRRRGQPEAILEDLSTVTRRPAFDALELPSEVLMLHYVGAPLSGDVRDETRGRYKLMRRLGPNDGLSLLADELTEEGLVVTEIGLDHYFRAPDIDLRTVALTYAVFEELARRQAGARESLSMQGVNSDGVSAAHARAGSAPAYVVGDVAQMSR